MSTRSRRKVEPSTPPRLPRAHPDALTQTFSTGKPRSRISSSCPVKNKNALLRIDEGYCVLTREQGSQVQVAHIMARSTGADVRAELRKHGIVLSVDSRRNLMHLSAEDHWLFDHNGLTVVPTHETIVTLQEKLMRAMVDGEKPTYESVLSVEDAKNPDNWYTYELATFPPCRKPIVRRNSGNLQPFNPHSEFTMYVRTDNEPDTASHRQTSYRDPDGNLFPVFSHHAHPYLVTLAAAWRYQDAESLTENQEARLRQLLFLQTNWKTVMDDVPGTYVPSDSDSLNSEEKRDDPDYVEEGGGPDDDDFQELGRDNSGGDTVVHPPSAFTRSKSTRYSVAPSKRGPSPSASIRKGKGADKRRRLAATLKPSAIGPARSSFNRLHVPANTWAFLQLLRNDQSFAIQQDAEADYPYDVGSDGTADSESDISSNEMIDPVASDPDIHGRTPSLSASCEGHAYRAPSVDLDSWLTEIRGGIYRDDAFASISHMDETNTSPATHEVEPVRSPKRSVV